jgi:predicted Holliday junction resolvase-like endonuclease
MNNSELLKFFQIQRQIFGVCPSSGRLFRLSDCHIYVKKKPTNDWMQEIEAAQRRINKNSEKLDEQEEAVMEAARATGRKQAGFAVKKIDKIFYPSKLNPDDAKVIFHPVDYIVFNGMKKGVMKNLILMDKKEKSISERKLQSSIERVVEKGQYEWVTLRIAQDGGISEEK